MTVIRKQVKSTENGTGQLNADVFFLHLIYSSGNDHMM